MTGMLDDVTVLELAGTTAAAFAGKLLADAGAKVIRPGTKDPDPYLDHRKVGVDAAPRSLVAQVQVVLTDLDDEELAAYGLSLDGLREDFPGLIVTALSPLGRSGERAGHLGGELATQAVSGLMHIVGNPDREPLAMPYDIGAHQLGLNGAGATSAALLHAKQTGVGSLVEISGAEVLASYVRVYGAVARYYEIDLLRDGRRAPGSGGRWPFGLFPCKDGYVAMIARTEPEWSRMLSMMGSPDWSALPRYTDVRAMAVDYPDEVDELVAPWFADRTRDELLALAQEHKVPMAPVRRIDELADDVQMRHRGFFDLAQLADGREIEVPGRPWIETTVSPDSRKPVQPGGTTKEFEHVRFN